MNRRAFIAALGGAERPLTHLHASALMASLSRATGSS